MAELIITEKPSSAKKLAEALADTKPVKKTNKKVSYYELTHNKKKILVGCAVGHLFGIVESGKKGWNYPVFEIKWEATNKVDKKLSYIKDYIETLAVLSSKADEITIACDYDVEGEVIGLNIVRYICKKKDANRMKFSTLTKDELVAAYESKAKHLNWGQAKAGETRHRLDWFYGINLSRALTDSVKAAGSFKVMSVGRVQGPTLKLLVDREKEIMAFKPTPYWQLQLLGEVEKSKIEAWHVKDRFWNEEEVKKILDKVKSEKEAVVSKVSKKNTEQKPPHPFDLTTLQTEAYRCFKITPKHCLEIAQSLYLSGAISYPRTSSQQLDPKLGFKKIMSALAKQKDYTAFCQELAKGKLLPNNGKKTDPAHPAIYPTGIFPQEQNPKEIKVYDLIVKRFLATFGETAIREILQVDLDVKKEIFIAKGTRTSSPGWHKYYHPYLKLEEIELPELKEKEQVKIKKIKKLDKETQPPKRYNQSSIIRELEKRNLGTKATRADILDRLFKRDYIEGVQIKVNQIGIETIEVLEKYAPTIIDEELTRSFEEEMDQIRAGKHEEGKVLDKAKLIIIKILDKFKGKEKDIGKELLKSIQETREKENRIGPCPVCKEGGLRMIRSKKTKKSFIACDRYPDCETTFPLPQGVLIKNTDKQCETCGHPMVNIISRGKRPQEVCINPKCKSKVQAKSNEKEGTPCPKCKEGKLIIRRGIYGEFLACDKFPKCRYTERV
ncbi:MAG: DNA topoisomerase I [Candidatus Woesearchaeota archaeon]